MSDKLTPQELQTLRKTLARANEQGWGIALGLLASLGLFFATVVLVLKGRRSGTPPQSAWRLLSWLQRDVVQHLVSSMRSWVGMPSDGRLRRSTTG